MPGSWFEWRRRGIPHFHRPHAFIPRGRAVLRQVAPDVYAALLDAGASEVDVGRKVPGAPLPEDADLVYLSVRRPRGERLDVSRRTGCFPLFMLVAAGATALSDPEIFRRTARRAAFLDRMAAFDDDQALQERVERLFAAMLASGPPPPAGPLRDELLGLLAGAAATSG